MYILELKILFFNNFVKKYKSYLFINKIYTKFHPDLYYL